MDGFVIVNKEKGLTSHDVCFKLRKIFNTKKIGHTGTLDPNTTGVLVVAINKATKLIPILEEKTKEYDAVVLLGKTTDTLDITGKITSENKTIVDVSSIDLKLEMLKTIKKQVPPIYSAIKVDGKKLYEYARENKEVEIKERDVEIYELNRTSDIYDIDGYQAFNIYMKTSKGFYVRSLIRDLGILLDNDALMCDLNRISSGGFHISKSFKIDQLNNDSIISILDIFSESPTLTVNDYLKKLVLNGVVLDERQIMTHKPFKVIHNDELIAIYAPYERYKYKPVLIM
ncbi:MAG: tRNA pseudouridine(55) synthase TruB [Anaeroplasmataceae bacterium]